MKAFDRVWAMYALEPEDPDSLVQNTITPTTFCYVDGVDFTALAPFEGIENDFFIWDEEGTSLAAALEYKAAAVDELTAAGCKFPVIVPLTYKPSDTDWEAEAKLMEQQLEEALGTDYIDIQLLPGTGESFLANRRSGNYAMMRCNWGADYADPETWTDPFTDDSNYNFIYKSDDPTTQALYAEYTDLVAAAKAITNDMDARYEAFAKAEAFLLDHAFAIPFSISNRSYQMCNLNVFEGQYASFGMASLRYKDQHLYDTSMSLEEYQAAYADWQAVLAG